MELFLLGLAAGAIIGAAGFLFIRERNDEADWADLLDNQQRNLEELRAHAQGPRAVTRLTNRQRTIEL